MASLDAKFRTFLSRVRPTDNQREEMVSGHTTLRSRLEADEALRPYLVAAFLQGSYRRSTAIRPKGGKRSDVDVVVVTNLDRRCYTPSQAQALFHPFLDKHYKGKWKPQGRSLAIELSAVDLDLVVTAAPSEVAQAALRSAAVRALVTPEDTDDWRLNELWLPLGERNFAEAQAQLLRAAAAPEWKTEPLLIPDRDAGCWQPTNPLEQIRWTFEKSRSTRRHYVNVVKALKWWRRVRHPDPERPKSYPLEHIIGDCCPDGIESVAEGVVRTLEEIRDLFDDWARRRETPYLTDRGTDQNVLGRITGDDFARFHEQASSDAALADRAYDEDDETESARLWRELLGSEFPAPDEDDDSGSGSGSSGRFAAPSRPAAPSRARFA